MSRPSPDDFDRFVGEAFAVDGFDPPLVLVSVERSRHDTPYGPPYHLIFAGPPAPVLPEGLRAVSAGDVAFELYVIPVQTPARDRQDYQVVFN